MAKAVAHGLEPLLDTKLRDGALPGAGTAPGSGPIAPTWGGGGERSSAALFERKFVA